jgi:hypothetical protein
LPVLLLLHRQIPHAPRVASMRHQCRFLLRGRQQPEPRHISTVATDTDISALARRTLGLQYLPSTQVLGFRPKETS